MKIFGVEITEEDIKAVFRFFDEARIRLTVPHNRKNKIGIVIAIKTENEKEKIRLQNDLIDNLKKYLEESRIPQMFNIIILPEQHSANVIDHESSLQYLKRTRGHFIVYGTISERKLKDRFNYVFKLEGTVIHRLIPRVVSNKLSSEFAELFPRKWSFPESDELLGFEITQQWLGFVSKYIIGIASFVSLDFNLSYGIFKQLRIEVTATKNIYNIPAILEIKKRLPIRLSEVASAMCSNLYSLYAHTRNENYIKEAKPYLELLAEFMPHDYGAYLLRSIYYFLIDKNIELSIHELKKIENPLDSTWRYNLGFLYAYKGNLEKAKKQYDKAFKGYVVSNVINDTEIFISDVLDKEPGKYQLYFARGYINFKGKKDFQLAREDFKKFIEKVSLNSYKEEIKLVKVYLIEINNQVN